MTHYDTDWENIPSNKTEAFTKGMNMYIWNLFIIGTLNQQFIGDFILELNFQKIKQSVAKVHFLL